MIKQPQVISWWLQNIWKKKIELQTDKPSKQQEVYYVSLQF